MHLRTCILLSACTLAYSAPAFAIFNVSSPGIKKGIFEVESRNRFDHDDRASRDELMVNAFKSAYGITDRWGVEIQNNWQDTPLRGYEYVSTEIENKFRFYDPGEYWVDFALKVAYEWKHQIARADQVKAKFLFGKKIDKFVNLANVNFSKEIGSNSTKDTEISTGWQTRYEMNPHFQPGFEFYSSFGEIADLQTYDDQSHRIGPMFFGDIAPGWKYQAGYLFSISDDAEDGSFKLFVKYEFPVEF